MDPETINVGGMTLTLEEAREAGLLPSQRLARHRRTLAVLVAAGHGETPEARALRWVQRTLMHSRTR